MEYWLSGPVAGVPDLVQPVAHALLQVQKELHETLSDFDDHKLWLRPNNIASVGFHLKHLAGVLERLFTYAKGNQLTDSQLVFLRNEGLENTNASTKELLIAFDSQVEIALFQLKNTKPETLTEVRYVGRKMIPSTVMGLLFHAAEHSMRHYGQLLVTAKLL